MVVSSLQLFQSPGGLLASGMNRIYYKSTVHRAWIWPCLIQIAWPIMIVALIYFIPDSPRWLLHKGRREDAIRSLISLRGGEVHRVACEAEIRSMEDDIEAHKNSSTSWFALFQGTNRRRTLIASGVWTFQQVTGQTFVSSYAVPFWVSAGLGSAAFNYSLGLSAAGFVGILIGTQLYDRIGRRPVLMFGSVVMAGIFFAMGGLGTHPAPYTHQEGLGMVGIVIVFAPAYVATWGALSYVIGSEIGSGPLREKTS